jgi:cyclophilin family peptidyl-prolyl cis-trans isomerase
VRSPRFETTILIGDIATFWRLFSERVSAESRTVAFEGENLKCLNKKTMAISHMPTSRRFKKNQNQKKFQYSKPHRKNRNKIYLAIGIIAVAAVVVAAFLFLDQNALFSAQKGNASSSPTNNPSTTSSQTAAPLTSPAGEYSSTGTRVLLETSKGNITIQLRNDKPITTANFVNLTRMGIYDNTIFHRVIAGFMVQGGDPTGTGHGDPSIATIPDEIGNDNVNYNGTIAMANTGAPNSASSQFFINVADNNNLYSSFDTSYTVFGQVIQGMNVVMAISHVSVDSNNKPLQNVTLIKAEILP